MTQKTPAPDLSPLLTIDEAAKILRVSSRTVKRYIKAEAILAVRFGGTVRIRPADLDRFIKAHLNG